MSFRRTILQALGVLCISGSLFAQNTFPNSGNVGIGTSTPQNQLHLYQGTSSPILKLERGDGGIGYFVAGSTGDFRMEVPNYSRMLQMESGSGDLFFNAKISNPAAGGDADLAIIRSSGYIGIGTAAPSSQLHVFNPTAAAILRVQRGDGGSGKIVAGSSGDFRIETSNFDRMIQMESETGDMFFNATSSAPSIATDAAFSILRATGDVGVGTAVPSSRLHVYEPTAAAIIKVERGDGATGKILAGSGGDFRIETSGFSRMIQLESETGDIFFNADGGDPTNNGNADLSIIKTSGRVGIGTTSPDAKLTVKGDIHTTQVRVDLNGAVAPDYVFEADYDLRSLEETEAYIQMHKHLPEIPSAAEMEKEGLELKEMNLKLLQKVEELTLHLIKEHKENEEQRKQIEALQQEVAALKKD